MKDMKNHVRGSVSIVTCRSCGSRIPRFEYEADTDVGTFGLCSAAQCGRMELLLAETTLDEWTAIQSGQSTTLPRRIAGDEEFHILRVNRIEASPSNPAGLPFAEFRKLYRPPRVVYDCPCCGKAEATESQQLTIQEFEASGGLIRTLGNLQLDR